MRHADVKFGDISRDNRMVLKDSEVQPESKFNVYDAAEEQYWNLSTGTWAKNLLKEPQIFLMYFEAFGPKVP